MAFDAQSFLKNCSRLPGVYQMYDQQEKLLYVGKARDLKARLSSYFQKNVTSIKTRSLVARIHNIEITVTASEAEALLLEQSLIKSFLPPYNILLRDDKSYPYIRLSTHHDFPRASLHRGARRAGSRYFGPYPAAGAVRENLLLLEKLFLLRNCQDSEFSNRSRPCLQYEIRRCTAPCVGLVSKEEYAEQVRLATDFLDGKDQSVTDILSQKMEQAAQQMAYEKAVEYRDRIAAVRAVQQKQFVDTDGGDVDVIDVALQHGLAIVSMVMIRQGRVLGIRNWQPRIAGAEEEMEILGAFLAQHYLLQDGSFMPQEIVLRELPADIEVFRQAWQQQNQSKIKITRGTREKKRHWVRMAQQNAQHSLAAALAAREHISSRFVRLEQLLGRAIQPRRIECFDISHTGGEKAVASCVVFNEEGAARGEYRYFNVTPAVGGDDYAAMEEAVRRRYSRVIQEDGRVPGLLLIDGGKGQVARAAAVIEALGLAESVFVLGIAKGPTRKAGLEVLLAADGRQWSPEPEDAGLHLLQQVRDEAHRFALTGHRNRRAKTRSQSSLENIPGVGPKRRRELLNHFGGLQQLKNAALDEIAQVPGISQGLALSIHEWFHER